MKVGPEATAGWRFSQLVLIHLQQVEMNGWKDQLMRERRVFPAVLVTMAASVAAPTQMNYSRRTTGTLESCNTF